MCGRECWDELCQMQKWLTTWLHTSQVAFYICILFSYLSHDIADEASGNLVGRSALRFLWHLLQFPGFKSAFCIRSILTQKRHFLMPTCTRMSAVGFLGCPGTWRAVDRCRNILRGAVVSCSSLVTLRDIMKMQLMVVVLVKLKIM